MNEYSRSRRSRSSLLWRLDFNHVLIAHAVGVGLLGTALLVIPHRLFGTLFLTGEGYSHIAHEIVRCYGALSLAQSWLTLRTCGIADARVRKMLAESYSLAYGVTAVALARASYSAPRLHGLFGMIVTLCSAGLSILYAYFRFVRTIKSFELPGAVSDRDL
mmetsp:Transcript_2927/g.4075  ORF Transcript_2927/g.4075 Transcript_2927/m.4075 type:complete len:161 (+) Transcript_2927:74-556(+)